MNTCLSEACSMVDTCTFTDSFRSALGIGNLLTHFQVICSFGREDSSKRTTLNMAARPGPSISGQN